MTLEDMCIWKEIKTGVEGKKCKKCDGYNPKCEDYLTNEMISGAGNKMVDAEIEY